MAQDDFDRWNELKKVIDLRSEKLFNEREVWWINFGKNIGVEMNGKGEKFIRAGLIVRKYNRNKALVLPITSKDKAGNMFYCEITRNGRKFYVSLTQPRVISSKRFVRKIYKMHNRQFVEVFDNFLNSLKQKSPRARRGSGA